MFGCGLFSRSMVDTSSRVRPNSVVISRLRLIVSFFFFQAEDCIRDLTVTGVQTCALPISPFFRIVVELEERGAITIFRMARGKGNEIGRASCRKECRSRWSPYH